MKKITGLNIAAAISAIFFVALPAKAFCPICTVAVGAGLGLAEWLGIDDSVTGLWIGAFSVALSLWTINWLKAKNFNFKGRNFLIFFTYFFFVALSLIPLYLKKSLGYPSHSFSWDKESFILNLMLDKIIVSIILGSLIFWLSNLLYEYLKKKNNNHAHFPFEKIVIPVVALIIFSFIFYFITK